MRVRSYLKKKGQKQIFEARLLSVMDYFIQQAVEVTQDWQAVLESSRTDTEKEPRECICHGDYQYHNILRTSEGWRIVNLEKIQLDNPIRDLYLFMRKVMEKNTWNIVQGREILGAYNAVRALD
jgi:thiamine kinase-like enzyme